MLKKGFSYDSGERAAALSEAKPVFYSMKCYGVPSEPAELRPPPCTVGWFSERHMQTCKVMTSRHLHPIPSLGHAQIYPSNLFQLSWCWSSKPQKPGSDRALVCSGLGLVCFCVTAVRRTSLKRRKRRYKQKSLLEDWGGVCSFILPFINHLCSVKL